MPPLSLHHAIQNYYVICRAEGMPAPTRRITLSALTQLDAYIGDLDVFELEPLHILLFFTAQRIIDLRSGQKVQQAGHFTRYAPLFRFLCWLQANELIDAGLLERLSQSRGMTPRILHSKKTKKQHPPDDGGCS